MRFRDKHLVPLDDEYREMLGFLFVITVVFIVGTLAINTYKDSLYKANASEILTNITDVRLRFQEHYAANHLFPDSDDVRSYFKNADYMTLESYEEWLDETATITAAVITVGIVSDLQEIDGDTVSFTALRDSSKGVLIWLCGYASHKDYPFANAYSKTTLKREYLPEICRD